MRAHTQPLHSLPAAGAQVRARWSLGGRDSLRCHV
jgi:hypothetical protein